MTTTRPLVIGLDLSLTCTGIAGAGWTEHIRPTTRGHQRLAFLLDEIGTFIRAADLAVIEGPSFGGGVKHRHEDLAGLRVMVRQWCWTHHIPYAVVPPSCRALYAAGRGNASKGEVRTTVAERYGIELEGRARYDEADAYALLAMGLDWLGHPLAAVPEKNATALTGCQWPELTEVAA
jgi:Holliday junction resolvasome RuvABC endonuclease subunit